LYDFLNQQAPSGILEEDPTDEDWYEKSTGAEKLVIEQWNSSVSEWYQHFHRRSAAAGIYPDEKQTTAALSAELRASFRRTAPEVKLEGYVPNTMDASIRKKRGI
jgi:hypothetical protein